ncbi:MAG TPA: DUF1150 family protein [Rhodospirillales bacterium]|jgi:hypothetical protein|nr:DUF1150 family protein [Rhodospirillales bacterium]|tara:strand:- start:290 stop:535 length:246 start_codon:yes stop_codon:yes gene_type:complete
MRHDHGSSDNPTPDQRFRRISANDLVLLGLEYVAFVKPVVIEGKKAYAIYAADGNQLGLAPGREAACAAVLQNDLEPVSVH